MEEAMGEIVFDKLDGRRRLYCTTDRVYIHKSREKGEKNLVRLAGREDIEDEVTWLFCRDTSTWFCLTTESKESERGLENTFISFPYSLLGKRFSQYHIHPNSFQKKRIMSMPNFMAAKEANPEGADSIERIVGISQVFPSHYDMATNAGIMQDPKIAGGCDVDFRIATTYGISEVRFEPGFSMPPEKFEAEYLRLLKQVIFEECLPSISREFIREHRNVIPLIRKAARRMNYLLTGVKLKFRTI